jgi:pyruvate formate lyase activating enzyme
MTLGGIQRVSLIDYPNTVACVLFTRGCNFRCPFCHNPDLVVPSLYRKPLDTAHVDSFLVRRGKKLDGVVVSGGEPTIQEDIVCYLKKLKCSGYKVKLDTNGGRPDVLERIVADGIVDYIAMDVKAPLDRYKKLCGVPVDVGRIKDSISLIKGSGLLHEFRTTVIKPLLGLRDLIRIRTLLGNGEPYRLLPCRTERAMIDRTLSTHPQFSEEEIALFGKEINARC